MLIGQSSNTALKPRLLSHKQLCMLGSQVAFVLSEAQINLLTGLLLDPVWGRNLILRQNLILHSVWFITDFKHSVRPVPLKCLCDQLDLRFIDHEDLIRWNCRFH